MCSFLPELKKVPPAKNDYVNFLVDKCDEYSYKKLAGSKRSK